MEFESIEKVRKFYTSFAKKNGFGYVFNQPKSVCYMRYHKNMRAAAKVLVKKFEDEGLPTVKVAIVLNNGDSSFSNRDSWNHIKNLRRKNLDVGVIEAVFNYYESESTFTCLFKTWLEAMGGKKNPVSILIDQDLAIGAAIAKRSESINAFFDSFVHTTTTLQEFVVKFEKAVDSRLEAKRREDYESRHKSHILSIWSKLENHAAFVYTRNVLGKFQDELRKINQYTKKKIKRDGSVMSIEYLTSKIAKCGCQLYEFIGILCKHILMIFKAKGIVEIPNHFVLQRWTKDANKGLEAGYTEDKFVGASITPRILRMMLAQQQANILVDHAEDSEDMYKFIILQFAKTHKLTIIMQTNFNDADNMPLLESDRTNGNQHCTLEQMSKAPHLILGDPAYHKGEKKG
uniref:Protein FAR1-RELATED SEQUENCE n=1 Tax=Glycine max TaxID=3847 RepID=A0A0R0HDU2_SOYBN